MRILPVPRCCHGPPFSAGLVTPYVEQPPYRDPPPLQLYEEAAGAELFDRAAGDQVVGSLSAPLRVTIDGVQGVRSVPSEPAHATHCDFLVRLTHLEAPCTGPMWGTWAEVTAGDGQTGWLLMHVSFEGH